MASNFAGILKKGEQLLLDHTVRGAVFMVVLLEIASLVAYLFPEISFVLLVVIGLMMALSIFLAPQIAVSFLVVELVYGAFGRMISVDFFSLRMAVYLGFMIGYAARYWFTRENVPRVIHRRYALMLFILGMGVCVGIVLGNDLARIFADVNAFFFIPLLLLSLRFLERERAHYITLIFTTVLLFSCKTILVFWYFAGGTPVAGNAVYHYVRDTRVFEVTVVTDQVSRVFSTASFMAAIPLLYVLVKRITATSLICGSLLGAVLLIGFSRSLLVGLFCAVGYLAVHDWRVIGRGILVVGGGMAIVFVTLFSASYQGGFADLWYNRTRNIGTEVAAVSRFEQVGPLLDAISERPKFGHGFGATLRIDTRQSQADGLIERHAFEWGYLDIQFKLGILGIILAILLYDLARRGNTKTARAITLTVFVTHFFTPLLFHPLGMGMLVFASLLNLKSVDEISGTDKVFSFDLEPLK